LAPDEKEIPLAPQMDGSGLVHAKPDMLFRDSTFPRVRTWLLVITRFWCFRSRQSCSS